MIRVISLSLWLFLSIAADAGAHELRPAYLELRESASQQVDVLWKVPMRGDRRLSLVPALSGSGSRLAPVAARESAGASVQTWRLHLDQPLRGQTVHIDGLSSTMTDALVRVSFADGTGWVARLTPQEPHAWIPAVPGSGEVAATYSRLGVEHILLGVDHLLFVLALLLVTKTARRIFLTITAFTVAHSLTLALATLGFVRLPSQPVEAIIALSIAFVAADVVRENRGGAAGWISRAPWSVAFAFGLLHGLGFAGALAEIGLPTGHIPLALFLFNLGVEAGQLLFVVTVVVAAGALRSLERFLPPRAFLAPAYAIGGTAMFWVIERVAEFR